jgi:hypothetical protein
MNSMLRNTILPPALSVLVLAASAVVVAQVPSPFPRPGQGTAPQPQTGTAAPVQTPARPAAPSQTPPQAPAVDGVPTEATLGAPIYPSAQYLESYDATRGQRFYVFGSQSDFLQIVAFYKTMLKQKGELIFEEPPVHMFELGRFREETMGFAPSVTVKDYSWGGSQGYLNPKRGAEPPRFRTIIQIVPAPPAAAK